MAQQEARLALLPANALKGKRLGISASDSPDLGRLGVSEAQFRITLGELARTVVNAGGDLFYGGHLQPDGLTRVLLKELERYGRDDRPLKVCLSWTVHRKMTAEQLRLQQKIAGAYGEICCLGLGGQPMKAPSEEPPIAEFTAEESATALSNLRAYITAKALLHKSAADRTSPFPGQIYPATSVMGVPSAVKPLSTATRTWNSAT